MIDYYPIGLLKKIKTHIVNGGVIAYPTESCYGLGCNPFDYKAVDKIIKIKERDPSKGMIVIASKQKQLEKLIQPIKLIDQLEIDKYWPGFITLVLPANLKNVPSNLLGKNKELAVRVSKHKYVIELCNYLNMPLVSTSANKSGHKPIKTYADCQKQFNHSVMVLPGLIGYAQNPSTIIDWQTRQILR